MINYSIVMRNVNANLLEINQVKVQWKITFHLPKQQGCGIADENTVGQFLSDHVIGFPQGTVRPIRRCSPMADVFWRHVPQLSRLACIVTL